MKISLEQHLNRLSLLLGELEYEIGKTINELRESKSTGDSRSNHPSSGTWDEHFNSLFATFSSTDNKTIGKVNWTWKDDAQSVYDDLLEILIGKQKDYGPDNIRLAPGGPLNGLRVRLYDKIARLSNLLDTGATPENESLRDTFIDIANYGVIGVMILDDTFPKSKDN